MPSCALHCLLGFSPAGRLPGIMRRGAARFILFAIGLAHRRCQIFTAFGLAWPPPRAWHHRAQRIYRRFFQLFYYPVCLRVCQRAWHRGLCDQQLPHHRGPVLRANAVFRNGARRSTRRVYCPILPAILVAPPDFVQHFFAPHRLAPRV